MLGTTSGTFHIATSSTPSMSRAVTTQPPVPGREDIQSPPVFAQLEASGPWTTSKGKAGLLLCLCPQDGDINPLLLPGPAYKAASLKRPSLKSRARGTVFLMVDELCSQRCILSLESQHPQCCPSYWWCCTARHRSTRGRAEPPAVPRRSGASMCRSGPPRRCTGDLQGQSAQG